MASLRVVSFLTYCLVGIVLMCGHGQSSELSEITTSSNVNAQPSWPMPGKQKYLAEENNVLQAMMIHRDHTDSPLRNANSTKFERAMAAAKRSYARRDHIARRLAATTTDLIDPIINDLAESLEYLISISLGTPAQTFLGMMDTGSDLIWVQCAPCTNCPKQRDVLFDPSHSSSYSTISCDDPFCLVNGFTCGLDNQTCKYEVIYGDNTTVTGVLAQEDITLVDSTYSYTTFTNLTFGCTETNIGGPGAVGDGIVGFGLGNLSLPSQLAQLYSQVFSFCLVSDNSATPDSMSTLLIGSQNPLSGMVYTPLLSNPLLPSFYYANMTGISINGIDLGLPQYALNTSSGLGGTIFDSGTTLTLLAATAINTIVQRLKSLIIYPISNVVHNEFPLCYELSNVTNATFPTMTFHFTGVNNSTVDFPLSGENSFLDVGTNITCLIFGTTETSFPQIIGNIIQSNHFIEFNVVDELIGWIQQIC